ncbi:N-acylneuraminate cytidylyltransferase A [Procambarus clarkii]|uniref:N-acylneuraminate cytidylyltransferase A n=1 Tax=Procambarus clarkii TaxID=6728 RepID=UPI003744A484
MSITGLVLARGGSKSIKRKNLVLLNNQPLLLRCLEVVRGRIPPPGGRAAKALLQEAGIILALAGVVLLRPRPRRSPGLESLCLLSPNLRLVKDIFWIYLEKDISGAPRTVHCCLQPRSDSSCNGVDTNRFNSIWVSTDDEKIAECAVKGGAKVHHRAEYTAADEASSLCAVQEFLQYHPEISIMCIIQCTSPFIQAKYLRKGMEKIQSGYDSVFSVTRRHLLRWSEGEQSYPLNFNPKQRPRRQDWAGEMYENGMFYFCRTNLIREGRLQGGRCGYIEVPLCDSLDIDSPFDIIVAQSWISYCQRENNKQNL